jgi:glyoxylase-like metal-dependent hydrolase (beta-lactamase superfamily II)
MRSLMLFSILVQTLVVAFQSRTFELNETFNLLPGVAVAPAVPTTGYLTTHLGYGTYMVTDGTYQSVFVVSTQGVILIDAPPTIGSNLAYAIGNVTDKMVTHLVYSHSHADHIRAASLFVGPTVEIIAHEETAKALAETPDSHRPAPNITFKFKYNLQVGNQTLQLAYKGANHCPGNIFIYIPNPKVLMVVDIVFPGWAPFSGLGEATNIPNFIQAHKDILSYDFEHYIGGHIGRPGIRDDVLLQQEYVQDLFSNCNASILLTETDDPVLGAQNIIGAVEKNNPGNWWAVFKVYLDVVAERCANLTEEKWGGKLGGADVFGFENAYAMVEHLRIDYDILGPFGE